MKAVIEYMSGEQETLIGVERLGQPIAERLLEEYDLKRMWLLEDDEDPDMVGCEEPFWSLETYWVTREDGAVARLYLNDWHAGEDIWEAIERDYPEAVELMDECPESDRVCQRRTWDETFRPGDGEDLAQWLLREVA